MFPRNILYMTAECSLLIYLMKVKEKKYETVETTSKMLESTMRLIASTSIGLQR